ncbi:MAG: acyltransferase [Myxococcales bacterium]|nr:acyltransferase [Myxococcales bacterium]
MTIEIAKTARVSRLADLEPSVRGTKISVREDVVIDSFVKIKSAGGEGNVVIGARTVVNSGCVIYSGNGVLIGEDVAIAANCTLAATNHAYMERGRLIREQRFISSKGGIIIEDDVWIGANCVLLDGAVLRRGCVVGAGALVRGELPEYSVNIGVPVRTIRYRE